MRTPDQRPVLYVIPHSHFDLIWRRPAAWYRRRRARIYRAALDLLEARPGLRYTFCQAMPLREFLGQHPGEMPRVRRLLRAGRLELTGAAMSIPDLNLSGGEAIVRNQVMGKLWLRETLGITSEEGCLEDAFGVPATLPQILLRSGVKVYRSSRMPRPGRVDLTGRFTWEGLDGSALPCAGQSGLAWGFGESPSIDDPPHNYRQRVEQFRRDLEGPAWACAKEPLFFLLVGEEHVPTPEKLDAFEEAVASLGARIRWVTFREYAAVLRKAGRRGHGPRVGADFSRLFTGCYSTRIRQKQAIFRLEQALLAAENILAVRGRDRAVLDAAWDDLFLVQFHDAFGGCHTRENAVLVERTARRAARHVERTVAGPVLGNPLPFARCLPFLWPRGAGGGRPVAVQRLDDDLVCAEPLSALSSCRARPAVAPARRLARAAEITGAGGELVLRLADGGACLNVSGGRWDVPGLLRLREERGTLWTEAYTGRAWAEKPGLADLETVEEGPVFTRAVWRGEYKGRRPWPGFQSLRWRRSVLLFKESPLVWLRIELHWRGQATEVAWSLRARATKRAPGLYGSVPFGFVRRSICEPDPKGLTGDVFPSPLWAGAMFGARGWLILHRGHPAFRGVPGGIENVLLRSPIRRQMPAFPVEPDATAWDNGAHTADFLLVPIGAFDGAEAARLAAMFAVDPLATRPLARDGLLRQVLDSVPAGLVVSSLARRGKAWSLRVCEARGRGVSWHLPARVRAEKRDFTGTLLEARSARLRFRPFEICDVDGGGQRLTDMHK